MKKALLSVAAGITMAIVPTLSAGAWHYGLTGSGACEQDGSYKVTWVVDNTSESQALKIKSSSNSSVVSVGTQIPAYKTATFTQTADGTKPGSFTLSLKGNWPSDRNKQLRTATVRLADACTQPTPPQTPPTTPTPPVGGRGGGQVLGAQTVKPTAQVVAPVGAVNAGDGSANTSLNAFALFGFIGSLAAAGFGVRRLVKQNR